MASLTVGIIGAGRIGKLHAENILYRLKNLNLKTIVDPLLDEHWIKAGAIRKVSEDPAVIFTDPEIDVVLISSPVATHAAFIIEAAKNGKHVFCEKPLSLDINEINEALFFVKKNNIKLQIGFNRRFDAQFRKIAETIQNGQLGKPQVFKITSRDPSPPALHYIAESGGIFLDMAIHDFDMLRFLSKSEIIEIFAMGANLSQDFSHYNDVDTAIMQVKLSNGALGIIENSRQTSYGYDQRVEVLGEKGCIIADNLAPTQTQWMNNNGIQREKPFSFFLDRYKESYCFELQAFVNSILNNTPCEVTGEDGLMAVLIAKAAKQSFFENRPVTVLEKMPDVIL